MGKRQISKGEPISQLPFLSHSPNHLILPKIGWSSYCMGMGRVWARKLEFGENPFLGKNVFDFWGKKTPKMHAHLAIHPRFPFFLTILLHVGFLHVDEASCVHPSRWESFSSFLHAQTFVLVLFSKWARKIYIFSTFSWILQWLRTILPSWVAK